MSFPATARPVPRRPHAGAVLQTLLFAMAALAITLAAAVAIYRAYHEFIGKPRQQEELIGLRDELVSSRAENRRLARDLAALEQQRGRLTQRLQRTRHALLEQELLRMGAPAAAVPDAVHRVATAYVDAYFRLYLQLSEAASAPPMDPQTLNRILLEGGGNPLTGIDHVAESAERIMMDTHERRWRLVRLDQALVRLRALAADATQAADAGAHPPADRLWDVDLDAVRHKLPAYEAVVEAAGRELRDLERQALEREVRVLTALRGQPSAPPWVAKHIARYGAERAARYRRVFQLISRLR